jgi:hypothetical protein
MDLLCLTQPLLRMSFKHMRVDKTAEANTDNREHSSTPPCSR